MAGEVWTDDELEAAVVAYLQMRDMELRGAPYNKAAISRALIAGPLKGRSTAEQRMQNISHVLLKMGQPWINGYKPLANVGAAAGAKLEAIVRSYDGPYGTPIPKFPPIDVPETRKLPPTGYWIFVCNRNRWDGEAWLRSGSSELLYMVSHHNRDEVQPGDLGVLRLNALQGTRQREPRPEGVYALFEVVERPRERPDSDTRFYANPADAELTVWRATLRVLESLVGRPVAAQTLPGTADFDHIRSPLMTSTIPLSQRAYKVILSRSRADLVTMNATRLASDVSGISTLERQAANLDPQVRERLSRVIERGPIGDRVKAVRSHRCQVCEALGINPHSFFKRDGSPYAEAHHVHPVSKLFAGSLGEHNIMVLCPNHHRQAHYGAFEVVEHRRAEWLVLLDGTPLSIARAPLA